MEELERMNRKIDIGWLTLQTCRSNEALRLYRIALQEFLNETEVYHMEEVQ